MSGAEADDSESQSPPRSQRGHRHAAPPPTPSTPILVVAASTSSAPVAATTRSSAGGGQDSYPCLYSTPARGDGGRPPKTNAADAMMMTPVIRNSSAAASGGGGWQYVDDTAAVRGLRQRKTRMPLPATATMPGKRSDAADSSAPPPPDLESGGGVVVPAAEDVEHGHPLSRPIELLPSANAATATTSMPKHVRKNSKFLSFQGAHQYAAASASTRISPFASSTSKKTIIPATASMETGGGVVPPYSPQWRGQHGVTEMADTKMIDAIFKAPRRMKKAKATTTDDDDDDDPVGASAASVADKDNNSTERYPKVVSPHTPFGTKNGGTGGGAVTTVSVGSAKSSGSPYNHPQHATLATTATVLANDNTTMHGETSSSSSFLDSAYPVDDRQWSIPSIRLATRIVQPPSSSNMILKKRGGDGPSDNNYESGTAGSPEHYYLSESYCTTEDDGGDESLDESYYSFLEDEYYTEEEEEDYDDEETTGSLGSLSRGSVEEEQGGGVRRRRRIEYGLMAQQQQQQGEKQSHDTPTTSSPSVNDGRVESSILRPIRPQQHHPPPAFLQPPSLSPPPHASAPLAIAHTNSFLEKIQSISLEPTGAACQEQQGASMDYENAVDSAQLLYPPQLPRRHTLLAPLPPPIPYVDADSNSKQPMMMNDDDDIMMTVIRDDVAMETAAAEPHAILRQSSSGRRRQLIRRRRRHRRMKREGAAVEWIQELQHQSLGSSDGKRIAESASSKFLTSSSGIVLDPSTTTTTTTALHHDISMDYKDHEDDVVGAPAPTIYSMLGGGAQTPQTAGMTTEDVVRALGMPHPLCRSSTIETGPFTVAMLKTSGGLVGGGSGVRGSENISPPH